MGNYSQRPQQGAMATVQRPVDVLKNMISNASIQEQFKNALGARKDEFIASVISVYTKDKALQTCKHGEVIAQALKAATLHLPLDNALGFAYLVVYNNNVKAKDANGNDVWQKVPTPTFILGYKGYIQLAQRSGQFKTINADAVYEGELVGKSKLTGEVDISGDKKSDKVVGYFAYFRLINGFEKTLYVSVEDMATFAKRYSPSVGRTTTVEQLIAKASDTTVSKKVGWEGNFSDMAIKTVLRRLLSKYGVLSVEMQSAIASDADDTVSTRDDIIEENANAEVVDITDVQYENVDKQTGEVKQPAQKPTDVPPPPAPSMPDY